MSRGRKPTPFMDRVEMVPFSTCWYWTGGKDRDGYGFARHDGKVRYAHRVSYMRYVGPIPEGMHVCHSCDEPSCVNPAHLWLGTHYDNMRDMYTKGRRLAASGERHSSAKLTSNQVREIRSKIACGHKQKNIAKEYGIGQSHVSMIGHGKIWRTI